MGLCMAISLLYAVNNGIYPVNTMRVLAVDATERKPRPQYLRRRRMTRTCAPPLIPLFSPSSNLLLYNHWDSS